MGGRAGRQRRARSGGYGTTMHVPLARNRPFQAYLVAAGLADTGFWIYTIAQGWLVLRLTHSPFWLGAVAAAGQLPYLLFTLAGGSLADRFERRALIAGGNVLVALAAAALAVLVGADRAGVLALSLLAFAIGTVIALEHPVDRAWLYDLVSGDGLGRAIALSSLEWSVARSAGPAIGGVAIAAVGLAWSYGAFALLTLPMAALAFALARGPGGERDGEPGAAAAAAGPSRFAAVALPFSLLIGAFTVGISPYVTLLPEVATRTFHAGARGYGLLAACGGAGAVLGAVALTARGELARKGRAIPLLMAAGAALIVALTRTRSVPVAAALLFCEGAVDTLMYALANTYVQECADDGERGRANGVFSLAFLGGIPIGNLAIGSLAQAVGTESALAAGAGLSLAACVAFWFAAPRAREAA